MNVGHVVDELEQIAPPRFAAEWDNVGLLVGSRDWDVRHVMLTIDLTETVLDEAEREAAGLIVAYHPPIFEPMRSLTDCHTKSRIVLRAARAGIAIHSPHTALDAAPGGVNDWLADGLGSGDKRSLEPFEHLPSGEQNKIVTFCPENAVDRIRNGLASVGAGRIGAYELCSFEIPGSGTFFARESASPVSGTKGQLERVPEVRLEMVVGTRNLGLAITSIRQFHPYEEAPIEIYPLRARPQRNVGQGRKVVLDRAVSLRTLVDRIRATINSKRILAAVGDRAPRTYQTIGLCPGAGGSLVDRAINEGCQLFLTGEMRHHDILAAQARGCTVVLAGHTNTERSYLRTLRERMMSSLKGLSVAISKRDIDPLTLM